MDFRGPYSLPHEQVREQVWNAYTRVQSVSGRFPLTRYLTVLLLTCIECFNLFSMTTTTPLGLPRPKDGLRQSSCSSP